jgi:hypothetical protein
MNLGRIFLKGNEEGRGGLKIINRSQPISHLMEKPRHLSAAGPYSYFSKRDVCFCIKIFMIF